MRVMAIVPARAGSKRLRGKNTTLLAGKPLWKHAVDHAKESGVIGEIVVSTNDWAILKAAKSDTETGYFGVLRPEYLATDDAQTFDVVRNCVISLGAQDRFDAVCILQPTSPLRTGADIAACVAMMRDGVESVVSMTEGPNDLVFMRRHADRIERISSILIPNGAVYLLRMECLMRGQDWYGPYAYGYVMPRERSVDIDVQFDMDVAEMYLRASNGEVRQNKDDLQPCGT